MDGLTPAERSWFFDALGEVGAFTGRLARNFIVALAIGEAFALLLALAIFSGTSGGAPWKSGLFPIVAFAVVGLGAVPLAVNLSVVLSIADTVRAKGLARRAMDALFAELLGITAENPSGNAELTRKFHGMPIAEVRTYLRAAARKVTRHRAALAIPRPIRWLANQAQRVIIWATVRVILAFAAQKAAADQTVDLLALRANLTNIVDNLVTEKITTGAKRLALLVAFGVCLAIWLALRYIP